MDMSGPASVTVSTPTSLAASVPVVESFETSVVDRSGADTSVDTSALEELLEFNSLTPNGLWQCLHRQFLQAMPFV